MSFQYSKYGCIISIDFGTTFSGSCYAITGGLSDKQINEGNLIRQANLHSKLKAININEITYKTQQEATKDKTPTIVIYDQHRHLSSWGIYAKVKIDNGTVNPFDRVIKEFKLHLPKSVSQKGSVQRPGSMEQSPEDDNLRATIDFFKVLYDHIYESLNNERMSKSYTFDRKNIRFILTVPAMWTDIERAVMRQVAIQAGLINEVDHESRLIIINESLAATLFSERQLAEGIVELDDKYIICDAGGGTVDIASFIKTEEQKENISFDRCQLTADSGGECGSTFIDKKMNKLLSLLLYNEVIEKNTDTKRVTPERKKEIKARQKELEKWIDTFVGVEDIINGKHSFGDTLDDDMEDQDYFDEDEDDFENLLDHATIFEKFELNTRLIEDKNYKLTRPDEFVLWGEYDGKNVYINNQGVYWKNFNLIIPFKIMVKEIFQEVINETLVLLDRQIKKVGGSVKATFLVGGLGRSPYLKRCVEKKFVGCAGDVLISPMGDLAAMRGAAYYGIDGVKRPAQTDIVEFPYKDEKFTPENYDTVICIDLGYDFTACSYVNLTHDGGNQAVRIEVTNWPGAEATATRIPTAFEGEGPNAKWGAQVAQTTNSEKHKLIVPSRLMSIVKGNLKDFLVGFLKKLLEHVFNVIKKNEGKDDPDKFRYCITMENSYKFFNSKAEMRRICVAAGFVTSQCDVRRVLLFKREDAAAIYLENTQLTIKKYSTYYMQLFFRHDTCHMTLHESVKISGYVDSKQIADNAENVDSRFFRNVRAIRSATIEINFIGKLISNLDMFVTKNPCIHCSALIRHDDSYSAYYSDLRKGFLKFVKDSLDFSNNGHHQQITIRDDCCVISISVYDILEHVFRPAIRDLVSEINRHVAQTDINNFRLDRIFLGDKLFEARKNTYEFLEEIFIKTLSEAMNIGSELITPAKCKNISAIEGAVLYGVDPRKYTERISRKTYMVTVTARDFQSFEQHVIEERDKLHEDDEDGRYDIESRNAFHGKKQYDVFYQPAFNPSKYYKVGPSYQNLLIRRGTKITENDQTNGIQKRFFVEQECLAYATVYTSEKNDLEFPDPDENSVNLNSNIDAHWQKIHQFEIYIKPDLNDPMNKLEKSQVRHYFDVRMIPDNNEIKWEANIGTRVGDKIPEFRFRDEILVATIYDDKTEVVLGKTSKSDDEEDVKGTEVGQAV